MHKIIIIGAGWHGSELRSYLSDMARKTRVQLVGFIDENKPSGAWLGTKILGGFDTLRGFLRSRAKEKFYYITATGDNVTRQALVRKVEALRAKNIFPYVLRHPQTIVGRDVEIGEGTCLAPASSITTRAKIGRHCILNVHVSVSHDCAVGDFVNINPAAVVCGNVTIGEGCYIGAGATIIDKVSIGAWTVIGAGAVVTEDIPPRVTAVGVPARVIKSNPTGR